ncbi:4-diphosphocytidyl-2-C-methyl-D-erythritol kinase [Sporomusaceae bacterium BoRhaA]|uniref:4-(cytidine 5'-diphospho)-2-C-methyl-D-erythritol kinase n=1 Tax=Pelorhabdus rhamnosifermentans TaxID=2772457 RepID=UPI001C06281E|nr:4-(cytidine 5'-diphospho)-2-C-methyl-D-erythritol kinase [Pelorhabdus rhamnosifermentans]MBU2702135.1 4-diphosphocytidyl-2-C-methyl-D-erythritol kinase [Pelorhabdus rhamnosifermentans]
MVIKKAYAKINLALDVLYKRCDGYHEVKMVMQSIDLYDTVTLTKKKQGIELVTDRKELPVGASNLAYQAAQLFQETYSISTGVSMILHKKIPMSAGLAGGSADAAAVLKGMNELFELHLSLAELSKLGAQLGSDVPFCLAGGTQLATGRGEQLVELPALPSCYVVLAKPAMDVSTAWVYGHYEPRNVMSHPDIPSLVAALEKQDLSGVIACCGNVLEAVTFSAHPSLVQLKEKMAGFGMLTSLMSGSGPTIFALTSTQETAQALKALLENEAALFVDVTKTVTREKNEYGETFIANKTRQL